MKIPFILRSLILLSAGASLAAIQSQTVHAESQTFQPPGVDWTSPIYRTFFSTDAALEDWTLEGGKSMSIDRGALRLDNDRRGDTEPTTHGDHLVAWLKHEMPADFLLEYTFKPRDRKQGLAIVFFNARGRKGHSIFHPDLKLRDGFFRIYHSGDLDNYHISYWAGDRGTTHLRKNHGFKLAAKGTDLISPADNDAWQTVQLYKRGGTIRLTVDGKLSLSYDDDGETFGPVHQHRGWIGLRQMSHTGFALYGRFAVYPLKSEEAMILSDVDFESCEFTGAGLSGDHQKVVPNPDGDGKVFRAYVPNDNQRSEIVINDHRIGDGKWEGTVQWYAWSQYLPDDFEPSGKHTILAQWHRWQPGMGRGPLSWANGHPNVFAINKQTGRYSIGFSFQPDLNDPNHRREHVSTPVDGPRYQDDLGRWVRWTARIHWSKTDKGSVVLYRNGREAARYEGANYLDLPLGPNFKCGLYTGDPWKGDPQSVTVYMDDVLIGDANCRLADLDPKPPVVKHETTAIRDVAYADTDNSRQQLDLVLPKNSSVDGPIQEHPDKARSASPTTFVDAQSPPFLIQHGQEDMSVPVDQSRRLARLLEKAGVEVELVEHPDSGHGLKGVAGLFERELDFLDQHFRPRGR